LRRRRRRASLRRRSHCPQHPAKDARRTSVENTRQRDFRAPSQKRFCGGQRILAPTRARAERRSGVSRKRAWAEWRGAARKRGRRERRGAAWERGWGGAARKRAWERRRGVARKRARRDVARQRACRHRQAPSRQYPGRDPRGVARERPCAGQRPAGAFASTARYQTTTFTILCGTTMTFFGLLPSSAFFTASRARTAASISEFPASRATVTSARFLPLI